MANDGVVYPVYINGEKFLYRRRQYPKTRVFKRRLAYIDVWIVFEIGRLGMIETSFSTWQDAINYAFRNR